VTGSITFANGLDVAKSLTIEANTIGFDGGNHSVTGATTATLSLIPQTVGTDIVVGGTAGGELNLNGSALSGYQGSLFIGSVPVDPTDATKGVKTPVPTGDITINSDIILGGANSVLVVTSTGNLTINAVLQAPVLIVGATGSLLDPNGTGDLESDAMTVIANTIGAEGKDITAGSISGLGTLVFGTHGSQALFNLTTLTKEPADETVTVYAGDLNVDVNGNAILQNSGQQAAANQQTGGLLGSGFIDVSVFQQISLYDVNGSGIQLPGDQCEEESSSGTGCGQ
jgi:hypothetical protein